VVDHLVQLHQRSCCYHREAAQTERQKVGGTAGMPQCVPPSKVQLTSANYDDVLLKVGRVAGPASIRRYLTFRHLRGRIEVILSKRPG